MPCREISFEGVWTSKNNYVLTFTIIESDWSVIWHRRLFSRIDMTLIKPTNIRVRYCQTPENFFTTLKVKSHVHWNTTFDASKLVCTETAFEGVWDLKSHHLLTFVIIEYDWSVLQPSNLFSRKHMILKNITYINIRHLQS